LTLSLFKAVIGIINSAQQQPLVPGAGAGAAGGQ